MVMITMHMTMRVHPANRGKHPTTLSHHPKPHPLCPHQPHTRPYTPRFPPQQPYSRTHVAAQSSAAPSTPTTPSSPEPTVDPTPIIDPQELCQFITDELQGCFKGGRGITQSRYTSDFVFRDPLVTLPPGPQAHQLQLDAFKTFFDVKFVVFSCAQNATDPYTFDVRWSMRCVLRLAPWRPPVQITGASVITVDPLTGRLASQRDIWDAVADIPAPSVEAYVYLVQQLTSLQTTPDLDTPAYTVMKKTREYEVRQYKRYTVAQVPMAPGDRVSGGTGFNELAAYTIGSQNATSTKLEMTTPVFTKPADAQDAPPVMQFVIEESKASNVPAPNNPVVQSAVVQPRVVAARSFGGWPLDWEVAEQERLLRGALLLDGLSAKEGFELARYNDPFTPPWLRRNEVLVEVDEVV